MDITECSYCGIKSFTKEGICLTCLEALAQTADQSAPAAQNSNETGFVSQSGDSFTPPDTSFVSSFASENSQNDFPLPHSPENWGKCPICNNGVVRNGETCSRCASVNSYSVKTNRKNSPFGKIIFALVLLMIAGGGFYYFYWIDSVGGIVGRFERATGATDYLVYDSYKISGNSKIGVTVWDAVNFKSNKIEESYAFDMFYENPGKSLVDFYKSSATENGSSHISAYKQGFDGANGWKYTNLFNQPVRIENAGDGFGNGNLGVGIGDYKSLTALGEAEYKEYSSQIKYFNESLKNFTVNDLPVSSGEKSYLVATKVKGDGQTSKALLVFDRKSGFMIGAATNETLNGEVINMRILLDHYSKFSIREKGYFGEYTKDVLIPRSWKCVIGNKESMFSPAVINPGMTVNIELTVDSFTPDVPIEDTVFLRPLK